MMVVDLLFPKVLVDFVFFLKDPVISEGTGPHIPIDTVLLQSSKPSQLAVDGCHPR